MTALPASATCGDKGGPGYRRPDGKCASWAELKSSCGVPPTTRCHPENVQTRDDEATQEERR
ncbi:hypothetical protein [Methylocella sp.]|uniref:hypothetical protein n=1 Tax=Methylocella sp. TaxID=1978226 RepID=UPI0035B3DE45